MMGKPLSILVSLTVTSLTKSKALSRSNAEPVSIGAPRIHGAAVLVIKCLLALD